MIARSILIKTNGISCYGCCGILGSLRTSYPSHARLATCQLMREVIDGEAWGGRVRANVGEATSSPAASPPELDGASLSPSNRVPRQAIRATDTKAPRTRGRLNSGWRGGRSLS